MISSMMCDLLNRSLVTCFKVVGITVIKAEHLGCKGAKFGLGSA